MHPWRTSNEYYMIDCKPASNKPRSLFKSENMTQNHEDTDFNDIEHKTNDTNQGGCL